MAKNQRDHERVTERDIDKIHQLYRKYHVEICLIAERFCVDESAIKDILSRPHTPRNARWALRWEDMSGETHRMCFETFRAARLMNGALSDVEWAKIEKC